MDHSPIICICSRQVHASVLNQQAGVLLASKTLARPIFSCSGLGQHASRLLLKCYLFMNFATHKLQACHGNSTHFSLTAMQLMTHTTGSTIHDMYSYKNQFTNITRGPQRIKDHRWNHFEETHVNFLKISFLRIIFMTRQKKTLQKDSYYIQIYLSGGIQTAVSICCAIC